MSPTHVTPQENGGLLAENMVEDLYNLAGNMYVPSKGEQLRVLRMDGSKNYVLRLTDRVAQELYHEGPRWRIMVEALAAEELFGNENLFLACKAHMVEQEREKALFKTVKETVDSTRSRARLLSLSCFTHLAPMSSMSGTSPMPPLRVTGLLSYLPTAVSPTDSPCLPNLLRRREVYFQKQCKKTQMEFQTWRSNYVCYVCRNPGNMFTSSTNR